MSVDANIRAALRAQLQTVASLPPVAWEGIAFTPVVGTTHLREQLTFQDRRPTTLGAFARLKHEGVYMLDVYTPGNKGFAVADDWVNKLLTAFAPSVTTTYGGVTVHISRSIGSGSLLTAQWTMRSVVIDWFTESYNTV